MQQRYAELVRLGSTIASEISTVQAADQLMMKRPFVWEGNRYDVGARDNSFIVQTVGEVRELITEREPQISERDDMLLTVLENGQIGDLRLL